MSPGLSYDSGHSPEFQTPYCKFLALSRFLREEHRAFPSLLERRHADLHDDQDLYNTHNQYVPLVWFKDSCLDFLR